VGSDLTTLKVADLMARKPVSCAPDDTVQVAAQKMRDAHVSSLGVVKDGALVGIVTTRDSRSACWPRGVTARFPWPR
jgi:CBS domain-containing protein